MPTQLKYVDPKRPRSLLSRAYAAFSATRLGRTRVRHRRLALSLPQPAFGPSFRPAGRGF
jgi:hypothetical protein